MAFAVLIGLLVGAALPWTLHRLLPRDGRDALAHVYTMVAGGVAAVSLAVGAWTFFDAARLQREITATTLYREHLELSVANPELADGIPAGDRLSADSASAADSTAPSHRAAAGSVAGDSAATDTAAARRARAYDWFVAHGVYGFESILDAMPHDPAWRGVAADFIRTHDDYFRTRFPCAHSSDRLRALVDSVGGHGRCARTMDSLARATP